jgi:hypothetical protein
LSHQQVLNMMRVFNFNDHRIFKQTRRNTWKHDKLITSWYIRSILSLAYQNILEHLMCVVSYYVEVRREGRLSSLSYCLPAQIQYDDFRSLHHPIFYTLLVPLIHGNDENCYSKLKALEELRMVFTLNKYNTLGTHEP